MKRAILISLAAGLLAATGAAQAAGEQDLAKASGCLNCHDVSKKKVGPAFKATAAMWKKGNVDVAKAVAEFKAKHPDEVKSKVKDEDITKLVTWIHGM